MVFISIEWSESDKDKKNGKPRPLESGPKDPFVFFVAEDRGRGEIVIIDIRQ